MKAGILESLTINQLIFFKALLMDAPSNSENSEVKGIVIKKTIKLIKEIIALNTYEIVSKILKEETDMFLSRETFGGIIHNYETLIECKHFKDELTKNTYKTSNYKGYLGRRVPSDLDIVVYLINELHGKFISILVDFNENTFVITNNLINGYSIYNISAKNILTLKNAFNYKYAQFD